MNGSDVGRMSQTPGFARECFYFSASAGSNHRPLCLPQSDQVLVWCENHRRCAQVNTHMHTSFIHFSVHEMTCLKTVPVVNLCPSDPKPQAGLNQNAKLKPSRRFYQWFNF